MKKQNILVIGGAGFIGSALCEKLQENYHVTSLDNYFTGSEENHHQNVSYVQGNSDEINMIMKYEKFDYIFHLGEYARVEQSFDDFYTVMWYNYHSFPKVIQFAKNKNAKLIYAGSSTKFSTEDNGAEMSPYAYTKANNTQLLKNYDKWFGIDYSIVYFYNVYGDHEIKDGKYATVIAKFLKLIKEGNKTLPVTKPGTQLRNFTHIDDIVEGLITVAFKGTKEEYGIGADQKYSILDLVDIMNAKPIMQKEKPGNRMDGTLKTQKLKELGWKCKYNLKDYIQQAMSNIKT